VFGQAPATASNTSVHASPPSAACPSGHRLRSAAPSYAGVVNAWNVRRHPAYRCRRPDAPIGRGRGEIGGPHVGAVSAREDELNQSGRPPGWSKPALGGAGSAVTMRSPVLAAVPGAAKAQVGGNQSSGRTLSAGQRAVRHRPSRGGGRRRLIGGPPAASAADRGRGPKGPRLGSVCRRGVSQATAGQRLTRAFTLRSFAALARLPFGTHPAPG
jgi:hypothetical protein